MINKSAGVRNVFSSAHIERGAGLQERRANTFWTPALLFIIL